MSTKSGAPEISGLETMSQEFERFRSRLSDALKPIRESIRGISLITEAISPVLGTFADQMKPISDRMRGLRFIGVKRLSILTPDRRAKLTPSERHGGGCPGSQ